MSLNNLRNALGGALRSHPRLMIAAKNAENRYESLRHTVAGVAPGIIRPRPYKIMVSVTAHCNARCMGCNYERGFMDGQVLPLETTIDLLDDAKEAGFHSIRLYGGEPLLHPDLPAMIRHCRSIDLVPYVTTNAVLLHKRIDELYQAGLRDVTVGFYGVGEAYDRYVQRPGFFEQVERSLATVRERYGDEFELQMNWLLMKPTASVEAFEAALAFARRFDMKIRVDLVHYSLPYFQEGSERELQFRPTDRPLIEEVTGRLLQRFQEEPSRFHHTEQGIRSIPDWLILGEHMRVPCTAYEMIWVGADGTVQMCYVTFELGNLHETRLRDLLFNAEHRQAAKDAFQLNCPNCHCSSNERIMRHAQSRKRYTA